MSGESLSLSQIAGCLCRGPWRYWRGEGGEVIIRLFAHPGALFEVDYSSTTTTVDDGKGYETNSLSS